MVLLYLESFGNPRKFARLARVLARTKPVIAVKSGRHALVTPGLAASSAALSEAAVATLFAQSGVIRTPGLTDGVRRRPAAVHPAGAGRQPGRRSSATPARWACSPSTSAWTPACRWPTTRPIDLGVERQPGGLGRGRPRGRGHDRTSTRWSWSTCRRWRSPASAHAAALRDAVAGATVPVVTTFLAVDGLLEHLAVLDADGRAGRGSVPSYRTLERAVAALAYAVTLRRLAGPAAGRGPGAGRHRPGRPRTRRWSAMRGADRSASAR